MELDAIFKAQKSSLVPLIDSGLVGSTHFHAFWEGYSESSRCSRDTYPESYITKYTRIKHS